MPAQADADSRCAMTQPTPAALTLAATMIRFFEGCPLTPYRDAGRGVWTVGYGFITLQDGSPVGPNTPALTPAACEAMLQAKLAHSYAPDVLRQCAGIALTDNQMAALCSFCWNEGAGAIGASGVPSRLRAGDVTGAAARMKPYVMAGGHQLAGLVTRRRLESAVFMGSTWPVTGAPAPMQQQLHARPAPVPASMAPVPPPQQSSADDSAVTDALNDASLARARAD